MADGERLVLHASFLRNAADASLLLIGKEPGQPLLSLLVLSGRLTAGGPMAGRPWSGPIQHTPARLSPWVALMDAYLAADQTGSGHSELHTRSFRAGYEKSGQTLYRLTVTPSDSNDTITAHFES